MNLQEIFVLTVEGLKGKLTELGLSTDGRKDELRERLRTHFGLNARVSESESDNADVVSNIVEVYLRYVILRILSLYFVVRITLK